MRDEFSTGWNEAHGRAANYTFNAGTISTQPHVGDSLFTVNNAKFLPQPRIGIAWSPVSSKTVFRGGFGMYNELQDALGYRTDQNAPFNPVYSIASLSVSQLPIDPAAPVPSKALLVAGGAQPDLKTPTLISWSFQSSTGTLPEHGAERGLRRISWLSRNYRGRCQRTISHHLSCFALSRDISGYLSRSPSQYAHSSRKLLHSGGNPKATPQLANTWTWFSRGDSNYNALQVDLNHRFSGGFSLRGVYTWSKALDDGDSLNATTAGNAPGLVSNPFNLRTDYGLATYDVRHIGVINAIYTLPFGRGRAIGDGLEGWRDALVGGWSVNSIVTLQVGFLHPAAQL